MKITKKLISLFMAGIMLTVALTACNNETERQGEIQVESLPELVTDAEQAALNAQYHVPEGYNLYIPRLEEGEVYTYQDALDEELVSERIFVLNDEKDPDADVYDFVQYYEENSELVLARLTSLNGGLVVYISNEDYGFDYLSNRLLSDLEEDRFEYMAFSFADATAEYHLPFVLIINTAGELCRMYYVSDITAFAADLNATNIYGVQQIAEEKPEENIGETSEEIIVERPEGSPAKPYAVKTTGMALSYVIVKADEYTAINYRNIYID